MLAIAFTFPAGRYHATPWGRHVNEADVAWPPDLWRISRALIAVWHRKLSDRFRREELRDLLQRLAEAEPPSYRLPKVAIHAHTRHYMPGKNDKRTLIFDAFARVDANDPIVIGWPALELDETQYVLLDALLENMGFLGRAESWVDAQRLTETPQFNCVPTSEVLDAETGEVNGDIVRLLAPAPPQSYFSLCSEKRTAANRSSHADGGTPRLSVFQKKLAKTLPTDWLDALSVETGELQAAGWSAPPAAVSISYVRPLQALRTVAPTVARRSRLPSFTTGPTTARYALYGKPLPRIEDALRIGEALRLATMGRARLLLGTDAIPTELSGHDLDERNRHGHAFWLPEDADGDGRIDHLLVHVPQGLSSESARVLTALQIMTRDEGEPLRLMLEGIGTSEMLASVSRYTQSSQVWQSVTPYLHPWHIKKAAMRSDNLAFTAIADQIRREWRLRGESQPTIDHIIALPETSAGGRTLRPVHFHRFRRKRGLTQPDTLGRFLELRFAQPVRGPLALGFGCHFGLGLFTPLSDEERVT
jgi:CRISPR-associated protein Csb2